MSVDNRTIINDCEATTGWTGDDSVSTVTASGLFFQNATSLSTQLSNADEQMNTTQDSVGMGTFSLDWSDTTLYMLIKDNLNDLLSAGGVQFVVGDGTDLIGYDVAGYDGGGMPLAKFFLTYKLDMSNPPAAFKEYAGLEANLTDTAITQIGYGSLHLSKAVGAVDNVHMDCFRFIANDSYALTINGGTSGTPETMTDVVGDDEATAQGWGMVANPLGAQFQFMAPTEWGNASATADAYFTAMDEQWYWVAGSVGATHFPMRIVGNSTDTIDQKWTNVVIVNTGTRSQFIAGDTNVNVMQFDNVTFTDIGVITFTTQSASNRFANNCIFNNCDKAYLNTMDMDGNTFNGSNDANGAVLWDEGSEEGNQDNLTFNSDGTGHAIHVFPVGAGPFTFAIDGYKETGYATTDGSTGDEFFLCDNALDANITINTTNGSGNFKVMQAAGYTGIVTVTQSVTVDFEAVDKIDAAIASVRVTAYLISDDSEVINTTTNGSGIASTTFGGSTPADVYYRYRKSSTGAQKYFDLSGFATIAAGSGLTVKRSMTEDDIADPSI